MRFIPCLLILIPVCAIACAPPGHPAAPTPAPTPAPVGPSFTNGVFAADGVVTLVDSVLCPSIKTTPGQPVSMSWDAYYEGGVLTFGNRYLDPAPIGALSGRDFALTSESGFPPPGNCSWSGERLIGKFTEDFQSFTATHINVFKTATGEATIVSEIEGHRKPF